MTKYSITALDTPQKTTQTLEGIDQLIVERAAALSVNGPAIKWVRPITDIRIDNAGLIESTAKGGRAIDLNVQSNDTIKITLDNLEGGIIRSSNDAFRINTSLTAASIFVINAGKIISSTNGQAIDFDAVTTKPGSGDGITISNLASGRIEAIGADAVRPGNGTIIRNAGMIISSGIIGDKNDAIDWQDKSGEVNNLTGGIISGQRHGVTSNVYVTVFNDAGASIIGRNGSGVGSDGGGMVVNYGRITGDYAGVGNGDGDGVDIDGYGHVDNYGIIEGIAAGGPDGAAEGVLVSGGGAINNYGGATITGVVRGVTAGFGTIVTNAGAITAIGLDTTADGIGGYGMTINNLAGGTIYGNTRGIFAGAGLSLSNDGSIYGDQQGVLLLGNEINNIINNGAIKSNFSAIQAQSGTNSIISSGFINSERFGILLQSGNNIIDLRAGSMTSGKEAAVYSLGISDNIIINAGTIDGTVYLNNGADKITNDGLINGSIFLFGGDDYYTAGAAGHALGIIDGGAGQDTLDLSALTSGAYVVLDGAATGTPDALTVLNVETVLGSSNNDIYILGAASHALGIIDGGAGQDTLDLSGLTQGVHVYSDAQFSHQPGGLVASNFETIIGSRYDDVFTMTNDRSGMIIDAGDGNDTFYGGRGDDIFLGGSGFDQATYKKYYKDVAVVSSGSTIQIMSSYGFDQLHSVEHVNFKDGYFSSDTNEASARIARIYLGVFGRTPDANELRIGVQSLGKGTEESTLIDQISKSNDKLGLHDDSSNQQFIEKLYSNTTIAVSGNNQEYYVQLLSSGASKSSVAASFFESDAFKNLTAVIVEAGSFIANDAARIVYSFYHSAFGRLPDSGGFEFWVGKLERGELTYRQVSQEFTSSAEWRGHVAGLTSGEIVEFVYTNALGRPSDGEGHSFWTSAIDNGMSEAALMRGFANSAEHQQIMTSLIHDGMSININNLADIDTLHITNTPSLDVII